jgi:hypothetical protein
MESVLLFKTFLFITGPTMIVELKTLEMVLESHTQIGIVNRYKCASVMLVILVRTAP